VAPDVARLVSAVGRRRVSVRRVVGGLAVVHRRGRRFGLGLRLAGGLKRVGGLSWRERGLAVGHRRRTVAGADWGEKGAEREGIVVQLKVRISTRFCGFSLNAT